MVSYRWRIRHRPKGVMICRALHLEHRTASHITRIRAWRISCAKASFVIRTRNPAGAFATLRVVIPNRAISPGPRHRRLKLTPPVSECNSPRSQLRKATQINAVRFGWVLLLNSWPWMRRNCTANGCALRVCICRSLANRYR